MKNVFLCIVLLVVGLAMSNPAMPCGVQKLKEVQFWIQRMKGKEFHAFALDEFEKLVSRRIRLTELAQAILGKRQTNLARDIQVRTRAAEEAFSDRLLARLHIPTHYRSRLVAKILAVNYATFEVLPEPLATIALDLYVKHFGRLIALPTRPINDRFETHLQRLNRKTNILNWQHRMAWLKEHTLYPLVSTPSTRQYIKFLLDAENHLEKPDLLNVLGFVSRNGAHINYFMNRVIVNRHLFDWQSVDGKVVHELTHLIIDRAKTTLWHWFYEKLDFNKDFALAIESIPELKFLTLKVFGEFYAQREGLLWLRTVDSPIYAFLCQAIRQLPKDRFGRFFPALGPNFNAMRKLGITDIGFWNVNLVAEKIVADFYLGNPTRVDIWLRPSAFISTGFHNDDLGALRNFLAELLHIFVSFDPPSLDEIMSAVDHHN